MGCLSISTVVNFCTKLFFLRGLPFFINSNQGFSFMFYDVNLFLNSLGIIQLHTVREEMAK